ncbi:hypothetical protein VMCG_01500 [Cytospora schulzeri]|uniref:LIM zinc-binding domain-containing protein n=1 Tax=Cytospora schulzeri TaxID=448051 RepID=A0A423X576_9PEZI|nr:hypothetical protein VMCG_01500 [Valsa malicola]
MFDRGRPKESVSSSPERKMAPTQGSYMNNEQFEIFATVESTGPVVRDLYLQILLDGTPFASPQTAALHWVQPNDHRDFSARPSIAPSVSSKYSATSGRGRDYFPHTSVSPPKPGEVVPRATYIERGQRWMEKEEAVALRQAMEDKDARDSPSPTSDEERLYQAALDEAAELVWQHEHGVKPPEPGTPYRYKQHLRQNSYAHARAASAGLYGDEIEPSGLARDSVSRSASRSVSGGSDSSNGSTSRRRKSPTSPEEPRSVSPPKQAKPYVGLPGSSRVAMSHRRRSSTKRKSSGSRTFAADQIQEEPEGASSERSSSPNKNESPSTEGLRSKPRSPFNRVSFAPESPSSSSDSPANPAAKVHRYDIHRNAPSQSRNPLYTTNTGAERPSTPEVSKKEVPKKHGMEIRSEDIRQATSMKLKDRSPKLPTPTAVSDRPGRPIVSFDKTWKAPDEATDEKPDTGKGGPLGAFQGRQGHRRLPETPTIPSIPLTETCQPSASPKPRGLPTPSIQVDAPGGRSGPSIAVNDQPAIPSISVNNDKPSVPSIVLPGDDDNDGPNIPVIVTPEDSTSKPTSRPLPTPQKDAPRVRPGGRPRSHWSPAQANQAGNRATARCHECNYPIEGRFVALAGSNERFHPQCFTCYTCGTSLEALEISPEPDASRAARLERIHRRAAGEVLEENPGETMAEDGDERLRFYCHLDWHELFAPRCKHCKTPILGEHIVALGNHWHYGHFFCAECGDPFEQGMTHIEKDGYAWCVNCQTKRTERRAPKCRKCRKAVIGQFIRALGGEWHDECFRCATCQGGFDDGQIFPKEIGNDMMLVLCTGCRQRELKG